MRISFVPFQVAHEVRESSEGWVTYIVSVIQSISSLLASTELEKKKVMKIKDHFIQYVLLLISVAGGIYVLENFWWKLHLSSQQQSVKMRPSQRVTAWSKKKPLQKMHKCFASIFVKSCKAEKRFRGTKTQVNYDSQHTYNLYGDKHRTSKRPGRYTLFKSPLPMPLLHKASTMGNRPQ